MALLCPKGLYLKGLIVKSTKRTSAVACGGAQSPRSPSGIADPVGGLWLPQGLLRRFGGVGSASPSTFSYAGAGKFKCLARSSGGFWCPFEAEQLEQVAGCAHQFPLGLHLVQAAQAEAAEATHLLDLAEDGFDDGFAHLVNRLSRLGAQFMLHGLPGRGLVRWRSALLRHGLIVLHATGGEMQVDARYL